MDTTSKIQNKEAPPSIDTIATEKKEERREKARDRYKLQCEHISKLQCAHISMSGSYLDPYSNKPPTQKFRDDQEI